MLSASLESKLTTLVLRHEELSHLLSSPDILQQQDKFRLYSKEYSDLEMLIGTFRIYQNLQTQENEMLALLETEKDTEMRALAQTELNDLKKEKEKKAQQLQIMLLPRDPNDNCNVFLEIRAAAGGDESAIFAGDLLRMYTRYAENQGWQIELVNKNEGEHGGFKEVICRIIGNDVFSRLKFESGAHRVQRVPETEAQGRIHTSTCTVAVLPEVEAIDEVHINPADLKIDTFRASGAGGQHVNKTDSAIRITHLPSGIVVECQDERSQHKNRSRAMSLLYSKLLNSEREKQQSEQAATRKGLVGTGDRSERIRTYNFPQTRLTDHRINLTLYKLNQIMEGDLAQIIDPLMQEYHADQLQQLNYDQ